MGKFVSELLVPTEAFLKAAEWTSYEVSSLLHSWGKSYSEELELDENLASRDSIERREGLLWKTRKRIMAKVHEK